MLMIEIFKETAVWHDEEGQWESRDEHIAHLLNATIPEDISNVCAPFLEGGRQGLALKGAQARLGKDIKVLKETEVPTPAETPGELD